MKRIFLIAMLQCFVLQFSTAQTPTSKPQTASPKPKLVIGLVIDQMRWDYLYRYSSLYSNKGFKRLLKEGYSCENTMIPYTPTYTAPGHTCIYTGSIPAIHGIVGNNWYSRQKDTTVYCTDDTVRTIGSSTVEGKMSPANLWVTTITDELKLSNNFKSKVIGIALKDRGAILPAGHSADVAYWYDDTAGHWISSSFYKMSSLPGWVNNFNAKKIPDEYMKRDWNLLESASKYSQSSPDYNSYEKTIKGDTGITFPHRLGAIKQKDKYIAFKTTPFANTYTFDFAKAAIENEGLGKNTVPDFLTVSISSTDYIGHTFGPNSVEEEDTYLRLDKDIADFLLYLDTKVGRGNYLFFLTADHGAAHVPGFLKDHQIPAGSMEDSIIEQHLNKVIKESVKIEKGVLEVMNYQVYLSDSAKNKGDTIRELVINELKKYDLIVTAVDLEKLSETTLPAVQKERLTNGYTPSRSGDIQFIFKPGYFDGGKKGTTHGLWNPYDSHIPLLFYGWGIKTGNLNRETYMTDIAATLAAILQIQMPSGCVGHVIREVMK